MWAPRQPEPEPLGWWHELSYNRVVARGRAERQAREQDKRRRQLRRRVEKLNETLCLAEGASEARRHLRRQGYERSDRLGRVEHTHFVGARVLRVR